MNRMDAKCIMIYYRHIPGMIRLLESQRADLEDEYNGAKGVNYDGMPKGSGVGNPTEMMGIRAAEQGIGQRLREIDNQISVLRSDSEIIRKSMDQLNARYKAVLMLKLIREYSWTKTCFKLAPYVQNSDMIPDSTARHWMDLALDRLAESVDCSGSSELIDGLLIRALRAR